ncbi:MAG: DUF2339 domain-containing protein [Pseudomonadota bacterium]
MAEQDDRSLDERIGRIEGDLDDIRLALWKISESLERMETGSAAARPAAPQPPAPPVAPPPQQAPPHPQPAPPAPPQRPPAPLTWEEVKLPGKPERKTLATPPILLKPQFWFTIIGVVLVVLGVVFLYRYSVEQGWITSPMKVAFGVGLGALLLAPGLLLHGRQRFLSQMLMAASVVTFYITGYAAFQLYELIPFTVAMAWMGSVTAVSFLLSLQQDEQTTAFAATVGGLATPFMLHQGVSSRADVAFFVCAVLLGAGAIYLFKGWRLLLWTSFAGGWISLLYINDLPVPPGADLDRDKAVMQGAVALALAIFWLVPLAREALSVRNPARWPKPRLTEKEAFEPLLPLIGRHLYALSVSNPFIALWFTRDIWSLDNQDWGWIALGLAALYGLSFALLQGMKELRELAYVQALLDAALLTMAIGLILDGDARFVAYTAEALALHLIAWKLRDRLVLVVAHSFTMIIAVVLVQRLLEGDTTGTAILNSPALSELGFIVALAFISFLLAQKEIRYAYQIIAYVALMGWFWRELADLSNGQALVSVAWGACALALLTAGIVRKDGNWRLAALAALFVVVGKLLLIDLEAVKAIWRVLLLVGFGAMFLVLSYFFQSLWRPSPKAKTGQAA